MSPNFLLTPWLDRRAALWQVKRLARQTAQKSRADRRLTDCSGNTILSHNFQVSLQPATRNEQHQKNSANRVHNNKSNQQNNPKQEAHTEKNFFQARYLGDRRGRGEEEKKFAMWNNSSPNFRFSSSGCCFNPRFATISGARRDMKKFLILLSMRSLRQHLELFSAFFFFF